MTWYTGEVSAVAGGWVANGAFKGALAITVPGVYLCYMMNKETRLVWGMEDSTMCRNSTKRPLLIFVLLALLCTLPAHAQTDDASAEALRRIEEAISSDATSLDLSGLGLTALPPEIGQLANLAELNVSYNQLTTLPPEIGQLTDLTRLYLGGNPLPPEYPTDTAQLLAYLREKGG